MVVPNSVVATEDVVDLAETDIVVVDAEMDEAVDAVRVEVEVLLEAVPHAARALHRGLHFCTSIITDRQTTSRSISTISNAIPSHLDSFASPFSERF